MSIPYELTGRTNQKARTRKALVAATRQLLAQGVTPTVEQAAAAASISRTTAYRYFPNQRALLVAAYPELEARSLLGPHPPIHPEERLDVVVSEYLRLTVENEPELRAMLRLSLDPHPTDQGDLVLRKGRAIGWLEDALTPLRDEMPEGELRRLVLAIRSGVGIEALVWLTDIAGLSREEGVEVMRWSARALLRAALAENPGNRSDQATRRSARRTVDSA
jgi:AcrR family transcriptional regulator